MSVIDLVSWQMTHGIVMADKSVHRNLAVQQVNSLTVHAPITVEAYSYPTSQFEKGIKLAPLFNELVDAVASDSEWLSSTLSQTSESDIFTGKLLKIYKQVLSEGIKQPITIGINRSDYMLHSVPNDDRSMLQVEINTIASSFGSLSTKISEMHRILTKNQSIPLNNALVSISKALSQGHLLFTSNSKLSPSTKAIIIMIVQPNEGNYADQRFIEYQLLTDHYITLRRATLNDVYNNSHINDDNLYYNNELVSVVYYRAGYTPNDYDLNNNNEWDARLLIEKSSTIKCPSISYHLAGTKKVQQQLAVPGELEKFISKPDDVIALRDVFAGLYSMDTAKDIQIIKEKVINNYDNYVMKPQREGGGNNIYGIDIIKSFDSMTDEELGAFIIMERIRPPQQKAKLVRDGIVTEVDCLCELGMFGIIIKNHINEFGGYLLRVKPALSDEGGVAAGYAVLSAPSLIVENS